MAEAGAGLIQSLEVFMKRVLAAIFCIVAAASAFGAGKVVV